LNAGESRPSWEAMTKPPKQDPATARPKPPRRPDKAPAKDNPRLAQQTRKILGKHYAAKYRAG